MAKNRIWKTKWKNKGSDKWSKLAQPDADNKKIQKNIL